MPFFNTTLQLESRLGSLDSITSVEWPCCVVDV